MIPFGDLSREYDDLSIEIDNTVAGLLKSGWFVLGKKGEEFEEVFADFIGKEVFAVGVGSGTEALHLALVASGVTHGDYVITVPNTAVPTVSAISFSGATPLFVDIDPDTYNIDTNKLRELVVIEKKRRGNKLKALIPVHLYGQSADMEPVLAIAREFNLTVIEDACQAHGAEYKGKRVGSFGDYACFSFYPSKNLGAYGDGGMITTKTPEQAHTLKMLRNYGQEKRYYHTIKGFNSRLDELQAAILLTKMKYLDTWNTRRRDIADSYNQHIINKAITKPVEVSYGKHVFHLYVIRHPERDRLQAYLQNNDVQTVIHYPLPIHLQEAYKDLGYSQGDFPVAEKVAEEILSLPIFPQLRDKEAETVAELINSFS
ncbi:MAG TPA: erythromycin biosynthesis sensory transduction protein eryC1 [Nitrospiraceae bacterium]|nr:erythromycin biosynthesis sensory transduction protein eryC1 [Nitrospiraceae bacterium]